MTAFLGHHDPIRDRTPISAILAIYWISTLASYVRIVTVGTDEVRQLAADRDLLLVAAMSGVALMATEALRTKRQVFAVLEAMCWGAAFCAVVGVLQYWFKYDMTPVLGGIPGFELNGESAPFTDRYGLVRVAGTALSPIEFGVACGMMLPLTVVRLVVRTDKAAWLRWTPVLLTALGSVLSVSRSGVLAVAVGMAILVFMLPRRERRFVMLLMPIGLVLVFAVVPGFMATMTAYVTGARADPSITTRTDDYEFAIEYVRESPWIGHGAGWYVFRDAFEILDNQFLGTAINFGLVGVFALLALLIGPALVALRARSMLRDPGLQLVAGGLAATAISGAVCSAAFDSFSFPLFTGLIALVAGLSSACWLIGHRQRVDIEETSTAGVR